MLDAMRLFGLGDGAVAQVVGTIALPVSEAVLAHRRGEHARAVDLMKPLLDGMHSLGGSHAQQSFLEQLFLDSAVKANRGDDVCLMFARLRRGIQLRPKAGSDIPKRHGNSGWGRCEPPARLGPADKVRGDRTTDCWLR